VIGATEFDKAFAQVERIVRGNPNVVGVGFGLREVGGVVVEEPAWRVYVSRKLRSAELSADNAIPREIAGWPTDVSASATAHALTGAIEHASRAIMPGVLISNLRGLLDDADVSVNSSGLGTLGFFALVNRTRERQEVLISNRHVLLAHGARRGAAIYRPRFADRGEQHVIRRDGLHAIATIASDGIEEPHRFAYAGEPAADYFVDAAAARLDNVQRWDPYPIVETKDGIRTEPIRGVARLHPLDLLGGRVQRVRKFGAVTGVTIGRVVDVLAPVRAAGVADRPRNIAIRGVDGRFVEPGDSGAVVVNDRNQAIGLVWGRNDADPAVAYACHIHPLLHALDVTMLAGAFV
jgi:hypothetical protein